MKIVIPLDRYIKILLCIWIVKIVRSIKGVESSVYCSFQLIKQKVLIDQKYLLINFFGKLKSCINYDFKKMINIWLIINHLTIKKGRLKNIFKLYKRNKKCSLFVILSKSIFFVNNLVLKYPYDYFE